MNQWKSLFLSSLFLLINTSNIISQNNTTLYNLLSKLPKDTILTFKTYDGSGQVFHPDIIYISHPYPSPVGEGVGYGRFYLTLTPYPNYNDSLENPCIYESFDGLNFNEPEGIHNPLANTPLTYRKNNHHNDDPDISYFKKTKTFRIFYIQTMTPDSQMVNCLESNDLIKWKNLSLIKYYFSKSDKFILSPSLVLKRHKYCLFYVNKLKNKRNTIEYLRSGNIYKWDKYRAHQIKINLPDDVTPWHIDVFRSNHKYYMLLNAYVGSEPLWEDKITNQYVLYFAESSNLKEWKTVRKLIDCSDIPDKDCRYVYRSSGLADKDLLVVWYSFTNWKSEWKIGIKKFKLDDSY